MGRVRNWAILRKVLHGVRRLPGDRRGVSALEFALIAPVLIILLFGTDEVSSAVMAQRRVGHATSEVGDLVSQYTTIQAPQASDAVYSANWVLAPFAATSTTGGATTLLYQQRITSVMVDTTSSHTPKVNWSCSPTGQTGLTAYTAGTAITSLPKDSSGNSILLSTTAGDSIIMIESTYAYTSPLKYIIKNGLTFSNTIYNKPRASSQVILQAGTSSSSPTSSTTGWGTSSSAVSYSYSSSSSSPSLTCSYQNG